MSHRCRGFVTVPHAGVSEFRGTTLAVGVRFSGRIADLRRFAVAAQAAEKS